MKAQVLRGGALALAIGLAGLYPAAASARSVGSAPCCEGARAVPLHEAPRGSGLGDLIYAAAAALAERTPEIVRKDRPIIVTTMVSVDDLARSSTFGRLSSQLILSKLAQRGFYVRDMTYMSALVIDPTTGETVLSRDTARILNEFQSQAVVAGTYSVAGKEIYLNIRLLRAADGAVLSSADVVVPRDLNTDPLVAEAPVAQPPGRVANR